MAETRYSVWLNDRKVGFLDQRDDLVWFSFDEAFLEDPARPILGLVFEQDHRARHAGVVQLPRWFSNLLPEGRLREWIAADSGVPTHREMQLLAHVGHDLPGAVRVIGEGESVGRLPRGAAQESAVASNLDNPAWKFSLAGVAMKFSMLKRGDALTLPAHGEGGNWIVKLPDAVHRNVPLNENAMMDLAGAAGMDVPEHRLVHRDELANLPESAWSGSEQWAYAVKRFDREPGRRVHIEDFAQVRNFPNMGHWKYKGTYETLAALLYRRQDLDSLTEFVRRLTFCILISNGDAHLKNWSLIYRDPQRPVISPAYDLVATGVYANNVAGPEDLALKLGGSRRFEDQRIATFARLGRRLGADSDLLAETAATTVERVVTAWESAEAGLERDAQLRREIGRSIRARAATLCR